MNLSQKTVLITGGAGALGRAAAESAVAAGATVHIFDIVVDTSSAEGSAPVSSSITAHSVDLLDPESIKVALASIGRVDVLFNIAGGFSMGPQVHEADQAEWDKMFAINVSTLRNMVAAVVPVMLDAGGGKIVNVGALGALQGGAAMSAYGAAKSTVMRLTESLAEELREQNINVNAVLPAVIDTPANRQAMPDADFSKWVAPADLAAAICFLGSDAARAIHGALLPVRGLS